ncbi:MAG: HAMP domain-containing sensor histidine kinase [Pseudomonadota bacterium]
MSAAPAWSSGAVGFYSVAVTILAIFFGINMALKNTAGLWYSALYVGMLASIWMMEDGLIGLFGWTERDLNDSITLSTGHITCAIGFMSAIVAHDPETITTRLKRIWIGLAGLTLGLIPLLWVIQDLNLWMGVINSLIVVMIISLIIATRTWRTHDARRRIAPLLTTVLTLVACAIILVLYLVSDGRAWIEQGAILRIFFVIVTFPTMFAVLLELNDMRIARDKALQDAVEAAQRDAEMSANLLEVERQYSRAKEVADSRTRQLSTASHDIRQPLASMRAELEALRGSIEDSKVDRLERALDHLNELTGDLSAAGARAPEAGLHGDVPSETMALSLFFDTLSKLFGGEAADAGIDLRFAPSFANVQVPPLVLIRIASNLIANAIKHSGGTAILVGVRRRKGGLRLDVIDNGAGFERGSADWALEHGAKGASSDGTGQGLGIVSELASTYDLPLETWTLEGDGTRISVTLKAAP